MNFSEKRFSPQGVAALWAATLYFAQGLPNAVVDLVAPVAMKDLGFSNAVITFVAAWAYLPWTLKALWSPLVDSVGRKRSWIVGTQAAGAALLAGLAVAFFFGVPAAAVVAALFAVAVVSATHDIAADGFYMLALDSGRQALLSGWRSTFFRLSQIFAKGGIVAAAGFFIAGGTDAGRGGYLLAPSVSIGIHLRHTNRTNLLFAAGNVASESARRIAERLKGIPSSSNLRTALLRQTNYAVPYMF